MQSFGHNSLDCAQEPKEELIRMVYPNWMFRSVVLGFHSCTHSIEFFIWPQSSPIKLKQILLPSAFWASYCSFDRNLKSKTFASFHFSWVFYWDYCPFRKIRSYGCYVKYTPCTHLVDSFTGQTDRNRNSCILEIRRMHFTNLGTIHFVFWKKIL